MAAQKFLDEKGRCCGRKPLVYKRPTHRLFCTRCDREYSSDGAQQSNWAWKIVGMGFEPKYPNHSPTPHREVER